jgi:transposase-like protein
MAELLEADLGDLETAVVMIDGSKALRSAVLRVFGKHVLIQRCNLHKRRNVTDYLPTARRKAIDRRLAAIFAAEDPDAAIAEAKRLANDLRRDHPDATRSLLEGLDEMFTVARLGIHGALRRTLTNTNCIESMISTVRVVTGRVKHWRDGDMKKRWIVTGMLEAQRSFRRVRGCHQIPDLVAAIAQATNPATPDNYDQTAA